MKILYSPDVFVRLSAITNIVGKREFSGYGFVRIDHETEDGPNFIVYDIELLDVGSTGWTEIPKEKILAMFDRKDAANRKLWFHRHPLGNGQPGPHNWSGTDQHTCTKEPLGAINPNDVGWALATVLTPGGWVGRIDRFKPGGFITTHLPVEVEIDLDIFHTARKLLNEQIEEEQKHTNVLTGKSDVRLRKENSQSLKPAEVFYDCGHKVIYDGKHAFVDWVQNKLNLAKTGVKSRLSRIASDTFANIREVIRKH